MQSQLNTSGGCCPRNRPKPANSHAPCTQRCVRTPAAVKQLDIAVIGAGAAGCATVWHLLHQGLPDGHRLRVHLFDAEGIAAGGSGAAAGLLHAYSATGKVLWRGEEAMADAIQLVAVAEQHSQLCASGDGQAQQAGHCLHPWVWRNGLVRPALNAKQVVAFRKALVGHGSKSSAKGTQDAVINAAPLHPPQPLTPEQLGQLVPGFQVPAMAEVPSGQPAAAGVQQQAGKLSRRHRRQQSKQQEVLQSEDPQQGAQHQGTLAGLLVTDGLVLHPPSYLHALWRACRARIEGSSAGSSVCLHTRWTVRSLHGLRAPPRDTDGEPDAFLTGSQEDWVESWDAIVVAAGAAVSTIKEVEGLLPVQLCQGYTLHMVPPTCPGGAASSTHALSPPTPTALPPQQQSEVHLQYPPRAPSLLGSPYLAAHGQRNLVIGATRAFGISPEEALALCQPSKHWLDIGQAAGLPSNSHAPDEHTAAAEQTASLHGALEALAPGSSALLKGAAQLWAPVNQWKVSRIRNGVRAIPPRTPAGSIPLLDCLPSSPCAPHQGTPPEALSAQMPVMPRVWVIGGLGARGLLYHAMLAKLLATAILSDDASLLPTECRFVGEEVGAQGFAPQAED